MELSAADALVWLVSFRWRCSGCGWVGIPGYFFRTTAMLMTMDIQAVFLFPLAGTCICGTRDSVYSARACVSRLGSPVFSRLISASRGPSNISWLLSFLVSFFFLLSHSSTSWFLRFLDGRWAMDDGESGGGKRVSHTHIVVAIDDGKWYTNVPLGSSGTTDDVHVL